MLKSYVNTKAFPSCVYSFGSPFFGRAVSTNSAIHRSLRRSSHRDENAHPRFEKRSSEESRSLRRRSFYEDENTRPRFGKTLDQRSTTNSRGSRTRPHFQEENTRPPFRGRRIEESESAGPRRLSAKPVNRSFQRAHDTSSSFRARSRPTSGYDYSSKPGGNREERRATMFGKIKDSAEPARSNRASSFAPVSRYRSEDEDSDFSSFSTPEPMKPRQLAQHPPYERPRRNSEAPPSSYNTLGERSPRYRDGEGSIRQDGFTPQQSFRTHHSTEERSTSSRNAEEKSDVPLTMPYTTPASEFLYGTSVIVAALKSSRRKLYKLYMYDGENREVREQDTEVRKLALDRDVPVERVKRQWLRLMDKMSGGRPHNGYLLEASPLPKQPITALERVEERNGFFSVVRDHQSLEDEAINGTEITYKNKIGFSRFPLVLLLDGILDPGNMGGILRTAFFFGVDSVVVSTRHCAPFSPITLKASAGAAETLSIMSVNKPEVFLEACKRNGWRIYAADAPNDTETGSIPKGRHRTLSTSTLGSPLQKNPSILILGGEGEGLRHSLHRQADHDIGILGQRLGQGGVDSLNVSVAAGLLCEAFLRRPAPTTAKNQASGNTDDIEQSRLF